MILAQLIIVALLIWFMVAFTVQPLDRDPFCVDGHGRFSFYLEQDVKTGVRFTYLFTTLCDRYRNPPPDPNPGPAMPYGWDVYTVYNP